MRDYGFIEDLQELGAYIFGDGNVPFIEYNPTGNWEKYLPKYEAQADKFETKGCTVWGAENQIETMYRFLYDIEPNYSERFVYNLVPIDPQKGVDPQKTYECIRNNGLIDNALMPMTDTLEEFVSMDDFTGSILAKGQNWLVNHEFLHEWLWKGTRPDNYIELLKEALKSSPIGVSVSAWNRQGDVYVSDKGSVNNHFCLLYKIDDEGYPWVFDSYDHSKKKLAKDHNIRRAKRIYISNKKEKVKSLMEKVIELLQQLLLLKKKQK